MRHRQLEPGVLEQILLKFIDSLGGNMSGGGISQSQTSRKARAGRVYQGHVPATRPEACWVLILPILGGMFSRLRVPRGSILADRCWLVRQGAVSVAKGWVKS